MSTHEPCTTGAGTISEYEQLRESNIRRNALILKHLGLDDSSKLGIPSTSKVRQKTYPGLPSPLRRSLRDRKIYNKHMDDMPVKNTVPNKKPTNTQSPHSQPRSTIKRQPRRKRKHEHPSYLTKRCSRPDCLEGTVYRHCSCDGSCLRGHKSGLCCNDRVLDKVCGNYATNWTTCNACNVRARKVRLGIVKGPITPQSWSRCINRITARVTFEQVSASYGDLLQKAE